MKYGIKSTEEKKPLLCDLKDGDFFRFMGSSRVFMVVIRPMKYLDDDQVWVLSLDNNEVQRYDQQAGVVPVTMSTQPCFSW